MIAIAVDDEPLMLGALVKAISASPDITEVVQFSGCNETLDFIKDHSADVAFLEDKPVFISKSIVNCYKNMHKLC